MAEKPKKKRIVLKILLILLILIIVIIAVPITVLYVQYRQISYIPSKPVERPDVYVLPEYPEIILEDEYSTDLPGEEETSAETSRETSAETDASEEVSDIAEPETAPPETSAETEAPETLPYITYEPPVAETQATQNQTPPPAGPQLNPDNSFANSAKTVNVYGKTPIYKVDQKDADIVNILVLGTDSRDVVLDRGRSDTMIVVSYNKKTGEIKMVSLLRDMLVPIEGYDWNRINTAYFFDGVGLAINTVNQLFGLDIQQFIVIDFNGAKNFIDHIGGIKLTLSQAEAEVVGVPYANEPTLLNGAQALTHMRNRRIDSDFGRTERQREVIVAVFNKILREKSLTEILDISQYAMGMVKTNISASTLTSLVTSIVGNIGNISIESQNVPYSDAYKSGWYKQMSILSFDIQSTAERLLDFLYE